MIRNEGFEINDLSECHRFAAIFNQKLSMLYPSPPEEIQCGIKDLPQIGSSEVTSSLDFHHFLSLLFISN